MAHWETVREIASAFPVAVIRREHIKRKQLAERIEDAWLLRAAPKRLVDEFAAGRR